MGYPGGTASKKPGLECSDRQIGYFGFTVTSGGRISRKVRGGQNGLLKSGLPVCVQNLCLRECGTGRIICPKKKKGLGLCPILAKGKRSKKHEKYGRESMF